MQELKVKPGDRVRYHGGQADGKTGVVEFADSFGVVCNVVWDDGTRSLIKVKVLEKLEKVAIVTILDMSRRS